MAGCGPDTAGGQDIGDTMNTMMKSLVGLLSVTALLLLAQPAFAGQQKVLVIHSYDERLAWTRQCNKGIRSALPDTVSLKTIYLNTKSIPEAEHRGRAMEAFETFRGSNPDLVMLGDDNALRLLGPLIAETGVPIVYFGINSNPRDYFDTLPQNVFGVIERIPVFPWIRWLLQIMPETESALVLMDGSPTADSILKTTFKGRKSVTVDGKVVDCDSVADWSKWKRRVLESKYDFILMPIYHALRDDSGKHVPYDKVVAWMSENSRSPVFATQDYAVGDHGIVGALVVVGEEHGLHAGLIAKGILEGERVPAVATADDQQGRLFFNRKQLERFGIVLPEWAAEQAVYK